MTFVTRPAGWALLCAAVVTAVPWLEPVETPAGLMMSVGFSPKPTPAPGVRPDGISNELRRRQQDVPVDWCGYVGGNAGDVLSCAASKQCVYYGTVVGCCGEGAISTCPDLYTSCVDTSSLCDASCSANSKVLKCPGAEQQSFCGTYFFSKDFTKYQCVSGSSIFSSVELIPDYYATLDASALLAIGPDGLTITNPALPLSTNTRITTTSTPRDEARMSPWAIAGIVGAVVIVSIMTGVLLCIWIWRRKMTKRLLGHPRRPMEQPLIGSSHPDNQPYNGQSELHQSSNPRIFLNTAQPQSPNPATGIYQPPPSPRYSPDGGRYTEATNHASVMEGNGYHTGLGIGSAGATTAAGGGINPMSLGASTGAGVGAGRVRGSDQNLEAYHRREEPVSPLSTASFSLQDGYGHVPIGWLGPAPH